MLQSGPVVDSKKNGSPTLAIRSQRISTKGFASAWGFQAKPGVMGDGHKNDIKMRRTTEQIKIPLCSRLCFKGGSRIATKCEYAFPPKAEPEKTKGIPSKRQAHRQTREGYTFRGAVELKEQKGTGKNCQADQVVVRDGCVFSELIWICRLVSYLANNSTTSSNCSAMPNSLS